MRGSIPSSSDLAENFSNNSHTGVEIPSKCAAIIKMEFERQANCTHLTSGEVSMIKGLLKLALVVIVLVGIGAFFLGRRSGTWEILPDSHVRAAGPVDTSKAREVGANVGEATANAVNETKDALASAGLTAKIKAKMALDDQVKARNIGVETNGSVVTLTGDVGSEAEGRRAVQLAKETDGVTSVINHLRIR
jgi:hypothetical protein